MSKVYDIAFKIAGQLSSAFTSSFKNAEKTVGAFNKQLATLNSDAARMDKLVKLRQEVGQSARAYIQAKQKVAELGRAISSTSAPSAKMVADFNRAKAALDRTKSSLERQRTALRELDNSMGTTGTHLQTLIDRQNNLARSADRARQAQEKLAKINGKLANAQGMQDKVSEARGSSAGTLMGMGVAVGATVGAPVKQAMNFEDQQAELRKFSDEYKTVFAGIQDLSLKYAKSTEDMTAMASSAFQSGIAKSGKDALKLIEIQNQMAIAFDMTGEEVGASFADIQSKMGMTIDQSKEVFDIVNQLGNTTSASSKDIVEVLARSGGALHGLTAMSGKQIAALAGSFRVASVSSETAATSMQSFINTMTAGSGATKGQRDAFAKLNIDAEKLGKAMTKSPESAQKAIQDVLARLGKLPKAEQSPMIGALFGNDAGIKSAVATIVAQQKVVGDNFALISDPSKYAGSMLKEFQARADTTSNSLEIMQNAIKLVAGGIGTALLPIVRKSAESFVASSRGVITWVDQNQALILSALKVGGAIIGAVAGFHALRLALTFVISPAISLYKGFLNIQKAYVLMKNSQALATAGTKTWTATTKLASLAANGFKSAARLAGTALKGIGWVASQALMLAWRGACILANGAMKLLTTGVKLLGGALKFLFLNPVGLAILAIAGLVAAGVLLYKNWDTVKAKAVELWGMFSEKFPSIASMAKTQFGIVVDVAKNVWSVFKNLIGFVKNVFTGQWSAAWENVKGIFSGVFKSLVGIAKAPLNGLITLVNKAIGSINGISVDIPDWVPKYGGSTFGVNLPKIPKLAEGGIATRSTLAQIGEGGEPEAVVPLSKLSQILGAGVGSGGGITVHFAPVINISGGTPDAYEGVKRGLAEGRKELEKDLKRLMADQQRLSFT